MFSFTTNVQWMTNLLILCGSPKVDLQLRYFWHHLKYLMYRSYRTELTFRETELTFSPPKNIKMKSWKLRWTEVTFAGQKWLLVDRSDFVFLRLDRTVFFVLFIGQKCRFPKKETHLRREMDHDPKLPFEFTASKNTQIITIH